ncbi:YkgJ family cysteine cluster protein [Oleiagrimonas sp. C23AA]|uniref:YkgJ family cysteine cluster protein n=1 Tax=Oleiagrimonas sp. C23AA TaxID=2719047 RepID=UPI001420AEF2|nr:YkgJ family cysteine cluster protein [Oleiagrimonas sp. C23AA]NII09309.1 YkgJ family cysteine cluster protein [Oleiagrimonas sp. C23AA]
MSHPCLRCGACCAHFRVAFHWSEADPFLGGTVPAELTEKLDPHRVVMRGTQSRSSHCVALEGTIGKAAGCSIHAIKPSVCRQVEPAWEFGRPSAQCEKARHAHGLVPLTPEDWQRPPGDDFRPLPRSA